jgi:hypothetical protein
VFSNLWYTEEVTANWISPKVKSMVTAPADRLSRQDLGLLIADFHCPRLAGPGTHRAGDQPELLAQNFAVGEIPLVVTLVWTRRAKPVLGQPCEGLKTRLGDRRNLVN